VPDSTDVRASRRLGVGAAVVQARTVGQNVRCSGRVVDCGAVIVTTADREIGGACSVRGGGGGQRRGRGVVEAWGEGWAVVIVVRRFRRSSLPEHYRVISV
jgi:hypothetical protein